MTCQCNPPEGSPFTCWYKMERDLDRATGTDTLYFLSVDSDGVATRERRSVPKALWVRVERACGFNNTLGHDDEPATAGFSAKGIKGWTERISSDEAGS